MARAAELKGSDVDGLDAGDLRTALDVYEKIAEKSPSATGRATAEARVDLLERALQLKADIK
jgi:hypothetical protein